MEKFFDRQGLEIKPGDVLKWDEARGPGYGRSIHEVILLNGEMYAVMRVGYPAWTVLDDQDPISLVLFGSAGKCRDAEIIGNVGLDPSVLSTDTAWGIWPDEQNDAVRSEKEA